MPCLESKKQVFCDKTMRALLLGVYALVSTLGLIRGGSWAAVGIVGGILLALVLWVRDGRFPWPEKKTGAVILLFLAYGAGLAFFSPFMDRSLYATLKLGTIFLPLSFFSAPSLRAFGRTLGEYKGGLLYLLAWGLAVVVLELLMASYLFGFDSIPVTKLNRGLSYGLLLVPPLLAGTYGESQKKFFLLLGLTLFSLLLTHSRTTQLAAVAGTGVFALARFWPLVTTRLVGLGMMVSLAWPIAVKHLYMLYPDMISHKLPFTFAARVEIWDYMSYRIAERPLLGWGLGSSGVVDWLAPHGAGYVYTGANAAHPHNAIIQLWVETGLVGMLFGILAAWAVLSGVGRLKALARPYALASLSMAFVLLLAAYDVWTDSLLTALALTLFLFSCLHGEKAEN
jgi:O-antigen ligase